MKKALMHIALVAVLALIIDGAWLAIVLYHPLTTSAHPSARHAIHGTLSSGDDPNTVTVGCNPDDSKNCAISPEDATQVCDSHGGYQKTDNNGNIVCNDGQKLTLKQACQILLGDDGSPMIIATGTLGGCLSSDDSDAPNASKALLDDCHRFDKVKCRLTTDNFNQQCTNFNKGKSDTYSQYKKGDKITCPHDPLENQSGPRDVLLDEVCGNLLGQGAKRVTLDDGTDGCTPANNPKDN